MAFPFLTEMLSERALGTLKLSGVIVERTINFCVRVQCCSAHGINRVTQHLNQLAAKKSHAMDAMRPAAGHTAYTILEPEQHTVSPCPEESQISHRYGWQSKKPLPRRSISKNCLSQLLAVLHCFYIGW